MAPRTLPLPPAHIPAAAEMAAPAPAALPAVPDRSGFRLQVLAIVLALVCFALFGWQLSRGRPPVPVTVTLPAGRGAPAVDICVQVAGAVAHPGVYTLGQGDRVEDAVRAAGGLTPNADTSRINLAARIRDEQRVDIPAIAATPAGTSAGAQSTASPGAGGVPAAAAAQAGQQDGVGEDAADTPAGSGAGTADAAAPAAPAPAAPAEPTVAPAPTGVPAAAPARTTTARATSTPRAQATARPSSGAASAPTTPAASGAAAGKVNVNTATQAQLEALPGFGKASAEKIIAYRQANGPLHSLDDLRRAGISDALIARAAPTITFE